MNSALNQSGPRPHRPRAPRSDTPTAAACVIESHTGGLCSADVVGDHVPRPSGLESGVGDELIGSPFKSSRRVVLVTPPSLLVLSARRARGGPGLLPGPVPLIPRLRWSVLSSLLGGRDSPPISAVSIARRAAPVAGATPEQQGGAGPTSSSRLAARSQAGLLKVLWLRGRGTRARGRRETNRRKLPLD